MSRISKKSKITLVELPATESGVLNGKLVHDIYSIFNFPPRALPTLTAVLYKEGFEDVEMIHPRFHGRNGRLSPENWRRIRESDVLGISAITRTAPPSMTLAARYKEINPNGIVIAGGMDPSYRIKDWLNYVDIVVRGEGEKTLPELLDRLEQDPKALDGIEGIAFKDKGEIVETSERRLLTEKEFQSLPAPYYDEAIAQGANKGVIEEERGCPYGCDFCVVSQTYGRKVRFRSLEQIVEELRQLHSHGISESIFFTGDNLAGNPKQAIEMLEALKESRIPYGQISAQVSAGAAKNDRLLEAMRRAKVNTLCVGFESVTDEVLKDLKKPFTAKENTEAAKKFRKYGFWIHAMMMTGTDNDTPETLREAVEWAKKYADSMQLFIITPLPGTGFYKRMEEEGRFLTRDYSLYDGYNCIIKPKNFSPYQLQKMVIDGHLDFYSTRASVERLVRSVNKRTAGKFLLYTTLGGLRIVRRSSQMRAHLELLRSFD